MDDTPLVRLTRRAIEDEAFFNRLVKLDESSRVAALRDEGFDLSRDDLDTLNAALKADAETLIRFNYEKWIRSVHDDKLAPLPGPRWPGQWQKL